MGEEEESESEEEGIVEIGFPTSLTKTERRARTRRDLLKRALGVNGTGVVEAAAAAPPRREREEMDWEMELSCSDDDVVGILVMNLDWEEIGYSTL